MPTALVKPRKIYLIPALFLFLCSFVYSTPIHSPTWGFTVDLPESYQYVEGNGRDRFSFENAWGARFDIIVYHAESGRRADGSDAFYTSLEAMAEDVTQRLNNSGDVYFFEYRQKKAFIMELVFSLEDERGRPNPHSGWALAFELNLPNPAMLLALAYGPAEWEELQIFHLSALDSLTPENGDRLAPGPITEFSYPRETRIQVPVFGLDIQAWIYEEDAEASQALIEREFVVLQAYADSPNWQEAWIRYYRAIYRDSFERLADISFQIERKYNIPVLEYKDFAGQLLQWVQSFEYERNIEGSDFINLISAAVEGKGDCDNRAMLWAIVLKKANIPSAMMVSREYGHAMGLVDLEGPGARFELEGTRYLVAETTANVSIGLIGERVSNTVHWLGVAFE